MKTDNIREVLEYIIDTEYNNYEEWLEENPSKANHHIYQIALKALVDLDEVQS